MDKINASDLTAKLGETGWSDDSRERRDWDAALDGTAYGETFTASEKRSAIERANAFKAQIRARAKKAEKKVKVKVIDKTTDAPMVVWQCEK